MVRYRNPPPQAPKRLAEKFSKLSQQLMEKETQQQKQKQRQYKKKRVQEPDDDDEEVGYDERNHPESFQNNEEEEENEYEEQEENDDSDDDEDDDDDSPRRSLPPRTHNDCELHLKKKKIQQTVGIEIGGEVATSPANPNLVSQTQLNSTRPVENKKNDYHKYDHCMPVCKLDPFTTEAYISKCVNEKLFPRCKFFRNNQDVNLFMAMVYDEIGWGGNKPEDNYRRMTTWVVIRQFIKKRTNDTRQLCIDRWYIVAKSKYKFAVIHFFPILTKIIFHNRQIG